MAEHGEEVPEMEIGDDREPDYDFMTICEVCPPREERGQQWRR